MTNIVRRIAVTLGAVAVAAGVMGATTAPAHAADTGGSTSGATTSKDSSWGH